MIWDGPAEQWKKRHSGLMVHVRKNPFRRAWSYDFRNILLMVRMRREHVQRVSEVENTLHDGLGRAG